MALMLFVLPALYAWFERPGKEVGLEFHLRE
jgi:hypothetical protein